MFLFSTPKVHLIGSRRGQATILSVLAMGGFLAMVLTVVSQYTYDLARLNKRSKDNVLVRGIVEEIAVELRRAYDMAKTTPACNFGNGVSYGALEPARPDLLLCFRTPGEICVQIPNSNRRFCVQNTAIQIAKVDGPQGPSIVLDFRWKEANPWYETAAYWAAEKMISLSTQLQLLPEAVAQQARSDRFRRPAPNPLLVDNVLNALPANERIRCSTMGALPPEQAADCFTIQVCDSTLNCADPKNVVTQRLAFLRN